MGACAGARSRSLAVAVLADLDAIVLLAVVIGVIGAVVVVESARLREFRRSLVEHEQ